MRLEDLTKGATVKGILPDRVITVIDTQWHGSDVVTLTYRDANGVTGDELIFRDREHELEIVTSSLPWSFNGDGRLLRLVSEAHRIQLAHLFDPMLAVHTSLVEPLPHQITAVYGDMLPRQPLRFLLADDPGAGKTIMTGLLISELRIRGDLHRCLIVCPGSLANQWQDELDSRFHLPFDILTNDRIEAARSGNAFTEMPLCIARLDKLSRNDDLQAKLEQTDWDLIVCDEAHKMSASFFGGERRETKRYKLGKLLSSLTRHFLLLTATPHNGKEADFQLFMALLDGDRFEGKFRDGVHTVDTSDLMRRLVKEDLLKFDGKPLFPERRAYTVEYHLSDLEAKLYSEVTGYVREEFNRADALNNNGRKGTVGFALTILQRRLASSPEAICQSLKRRRERLQKRLKEEGLSFEVSSKACTPREELVKRGQEIELEWQNLPGVQQDDWEEFEDDLLNDERESTEEELVDQATAARTIAELKVEIDLLQKLEKIALQVKLSGTDRKWEELSRILQNEAELFDVRGHRRKLVIFTEHKDTLNYLADRIRNLIGKQETVVTISGGSGREERRKAQEAFTQDPDIQVLIATDAAGEGINLQRAHLMVNYDLPWNPNRLEQRFGRIHRIGQTEVCHLWNLLAAETREGDVYLKLLRKLEVEQKALGGKVFDVLGQAIDGVELRQLLIEAIRYGDLPETRAKLEEIVTNRLNRDRLQELLSEKVLARNAMDITKIQRIREEMERAEARKLQPHFIGSFFIEAFQYLGGVIRQREPKRYQISNVPALIRNRGRQIGTREPILTRYERICFDKDLISVPGKPLAAFICPGHPLLDATIDLTLERHRDVLKQGSVLVDENDPSEEVRILVTLQHSIQDAKTDLSGKSGCDRYVVSRHIARAPSRRIVSRRMQYVEIILDEEKTTIRNAGYAPYLDYRPLSEAEQTIVEAFLEKSNLPTDTETEATRYAISQIVPQHLQEVKQHKEELIDKTLVAVKDRLTKEINYWDYRAAELKQQEEAGKTNAKINSAKARARADELQARLARRIDELQQERRLSPLPPVVVGGALIVPIGLLNKLQGTSKSKPQMFAKETKRVEMFAMNAVMAAESKLGHDPKDVSSLKCGYDIESRIPETGALRFIEVKGRIEGADTVTVTKNEIITALNKPNNYILAVVVVPTSEEVTEEDNANVYYLKQPFQKEPDFGVTSVNYNLKELKERSHKPC